MTTIQSRRGAGLARRLGALLLAACYCSAQAAPTLPQVVAGQASFSQQGNVFSITNTPGTIINWQSFNIGAGEITRFIQQSSDSAVLNRILGQDPSRILGALQSNGKVFLINPNGILFGQGARMDVNGLVASTLNLSDADFRAGKLNFQGGARAGSVQNAGAIATPTGGKVFLVAPNVENSGIIKAPNGEVVLAAGHSVQLVDSSDPNMQVVVSAPKDHAINLGSIVSQGGRIGIYGALVGQRGQVNANSAVVGANGKVVLKASGATTLGQGSVTSSMGAGQGGEVQVLGQQVAVESGAAIDASGRLGGGSVLVGGDFQGGGSVQRAQSTVVAGGAAIRADALDNGSGGKVVVWSDGSTTARGKVSARGAGQGAGGLVETSGHVLAVDGIRVDARGGKPGAKNGTWLLDPYDINVVAGGTASRGDVSSASNGPATGVTSIAPATLTAGGTDIVLQAQHDLTISDALNAAGSVRAQAGHDITVNAQVSSTGGDLDFRAGNAFVLNAGGSLKTPNYIDIQANSATLNGAVGSTGTQLPILSFTSTDAARPITVGSGDADPGSLWLDAGALARLGAGTFEINLGNSQHTGRVSIAAPLTMPSKLVLENNGKIDINAAVDLSANPDSRFIASLYGGSSGLIQVNAPVSASKSVLLQGDRLWINNVVGAASVSLMPNNVDTNIEVGGDSRETGFSIGSDAIDYIRTRQLTIGGLAGARGTLDVTGFVQRSGENALEKLVLDAGSGLLSVRAPVAVSGTVSLKSTTGVFEGSEAAIVAGALAVRGGLIGLNGANSVGTLAASTGANVFQFRNLHGMRIGSVDGLAGVNGANATIDLDVSGSLTLDAGVTGMATMVSASGIGGSGVLQSNYLQLNSDAGIGSATAPLRTRASMLAATNSGTGQPINIANDGALIVNRAVQDGASNGGSIAIDSVGGLTVPAYSVVDDGGGTIGEVRTSSGNINLTTHSPLSIQGRVTTDSGNVTLVADNGGALSIGAGARVASATGSVSVTAGSTDIASGSIQVSSPDKLHLPTPNSSDGGQQQQPPPTPSLEVCAATPNAAGCADVIRQAVQACLVNPNAPHCGEVMPKLNECQAEPGKLGCSVVLEHHDIDVCLADPKQPGCAGKIPTYQTCSNAPSTYGCDIVSQRHDIDVCLADPKQPGCGAKIPTYQTCSNAPSTYGCDIVSQRHDIDVCLADPKQPGCGAKIPSWQTCSNAPSTYGCDIVVQRHNDVTSCMATPGTPACKAILPSIAECQADASVYGCQAVVKEAQYQSCLLHPEGSGCLDLLPKLPVCKATPSKEGCSQVIELAFQACLGNPHDASCEGVLPKISECVGDSSKRGCNVVLPTLDECIGSPSLQGCSVRLPKLEVCAAQPSTKGCEAVLPQPAYCTTHSSDPQCQVFTGNGGTGNAQGAQGAPVAQAVQGVVQLLNAGGTEPSAKPGASNEEGNGQGGRVAGPSQGQNTGVKNEKPATKLYCN